MTIRYKIQKNTRERERENMFCMQRKKHDSLTFNISGTVLKLILKFWNQKPSESLKIWNQTWLTDNFSSLEIMFVQMLRMNHLTVFCFCVVWLSFEGSSKFGASCAKRWHNWAYNWLYLGSSRALSTILRHKRTQWMTDHYSTRQYIMMLIMSTYQQYDSFQDKFCIHTHVEKLQA